MISRADSYEREPRSKLTEANHGRRSLVDKIKSLFFFLCIMKLCLFPLPPTANITFDIFFNPNKALEPGAKQAVNRLIYQHVSLLPPINIHVSLFWLRKALNHCAAIIIYIKMEVEKANTFLAECPGVFIASQYTQSCDGYIGISHHVGPLFHCIFFFFLLPLLEEIRMWFHDQNQERQLFVVLELRTTKLK